MWKRLLLPFVGLWIGVSVLGQSGLSPNTIHYLKKGVTDEARKVRATDETADRLPAYLLVGPEMDRKGLAALGVEINQDLGDMLTVRIPAGCIMDVAGLEGVGYVQLAQPVRPMMDMARASAGVDAVQEGTGLDIPFMGKGVVVGIVDSGFDYTHPAFYDREKTGLRIRRIWEQGYGEGTPPEGFTYGSEWKTEEEILQAAGDVTTNSHGTHVAGIAAGADRSDGNAYYGIAGEADIVLVSKGDLTDNNVNISDAVAYIYRYAESVGKPCVVNLSLGTQIGPHDGTSAFDRITDGLQGNGRLLVGSVGNFGRDKFHVSRTFLQDTDEPLKTLVSYKTSPSASNTGGEVDIWGDEGMRFSLQVVVYNTFSGVVTDDSDIMEVDLAEGASQEIALKIGGRGSLLVTTEINPLNGKPHALVTSAVTSLRANHAVSLTITPRSAGTVHVWADDVHVGLTDGGLEGYTDGDHDYSLAEIGGTGKNILSVGAYVTRNTYTTMGSEAEGKLDEELSGLASFSSTGPSCDGRMKPDITAPGAYIASAVSSHDVSLSSLPLVSSVQWKDKSYYYAFMQGTSMAAPFVTGVLASWLQANPGLSPDDIREILRSTAKTDEHTGAVPEAGRWGYGKIDAWEGIKESLRMAASVDSPSVQESAFVLTAQDGICRLLFLQTVRDVTVEVLDISGRRMLSRSIGDVEPGAEVEVETGMLPSGTYLVGVKGDSFRVNRKVVLN